MTFIVSMSTRLTLDTSTFGGGLIVLRVDGDGRGEIEGVGVGTGDNVTVGGGMTVAAGLGVKLADTDGDDDVAVFNVEGDGVSVGVGEADGKCKSAVEIGSGGSVSENGAGLMNVPLRPRHGSRVHMRTSSTDDRQEFFPRAGKLKLAFPASALNVTGCDEFSGWPPWMWMFLQLQ